MTFIVRLRCLFDADHLEIPRVLRQVVGTNGADVLNLALVETAILIGWERALCRHLQTNYYKYPVIVAAV